VTFHDHRRAAFATFEALLAEVGATTESTIAVSLQPVHVSADPVEILRHGKQLYAEGYTTIGRTGTDRFRLFAYEGAPRRGRNPAEAHEFLWLQVHTYLTAWWSISAWRVRQLADAASALLDEGQLVAAASCARSLLETAATLKMDEGEIRQRWGDCRRFAPTGDHPLPSDPYRLLNDYVAEMMFGGKFKDEIPRDIATLMANPPTRKSVQTPMDRLAKTDASVGPAYEMLCNTVHPSVGGVLSYISGMRKAGPGEFQVEFRRDAAREVSESSGNSVTNAVHAGIVAGVNWSTRALDDALRVCDDIALTTDAPRQARTPYWRATVPTDRNALCPCRSGRKTKACGHLWGSESYPPTPSGV
jgi:hypothetical protein